MILEITKFTRPPFDPSLSYVQADNYFRKTGVNYIDHIIIKAFPKEALPSFDDSLTQRDTVYTYLAGNYNVAIKTSNKTKSALLKTVLEFFTLTETVIIRVILKEDGQAKLFGFIDISSMSFDKDPRKRILTFDVNSAEHEFFKYAVLVAPLSPNIGLLTGNNFRTTMYRIIEQANVTPIDSTNLDADVLAEQGFEPKLSALSRLFSSYGFENKFSIAQCIISVCTGFGIMFKLTPTPDISPDAWDGGILNLFKRERGITGDSDAPSTDILDVTKTGKRIETYESKLVDVLAIKYLEFDATTEVIKGAFAVFAQREEDTSPTIMTHERAFFTGSAKEITRFWDVEDSEVTGIYPNEQVTELDLETVDYKFGIASPDTIGGRWTIAFDGEKAITKLSFARCFVKEFEEGVYNPLLHQDIPYTDSGFGDILRTALKSNTYGFLIKNLSEKLVLEIKSSRIFNLSSYRLIRFLGKLYFCTRVSNMNVFKKKCEIENYKI